MSSGSAVSAAASATACTLRSAFESARTYACAAASMMSVDTPWPAADWPASSSTTLASPSASWPPVTASMRNSRSRASRLVAALIARKIASTGPSPVNEPSTVAPSGVRTATVACGGLRELASTSNHSSA